MCFFLYIFLDVNMDLMFLPIAKLLLQPWNIQIIK